MENNQRIIQEKEIDLRELFLTLLKNKIFIIGFTIIVTIIGGIYAYIKTPIYEAKALIEVGSYKNSSNDNKVIIDNTKELVKRLDLLFIEMNKNTQDKQSKITKINIPQNQTNFFEINAEGVNNELVIKDIQEIVSYVQTTQEQIFQNIKERINIQINSIERKIENLKSNKLKLLEDKIKLQKENISELKSQIKIINKNLKQLENSKPTLTALRLSEKRDISNLILKLSEDLMNTNNKIEDIKITVLNDLEDQKDLLLSSLKPYNYQKTQVIGKIITNDYPTKPKKKLIIAVSFVTGFILSIFLVFFIEFVRSFKDKND